MPQKLGNRLHEKFVDWNNVEHDVWIWSAPCCAMQYVSDGSYLLGDDALELDHVRNLRKNNLELYQTRSSNGPGYSSFTKDRCWRKLVLRLLKILSYNFNT